MKYIVDEFRLKRKKTMRKHVNKTNQDSNRNMVQQKNNTSN